MVSEPQITWRTPLRKLASPIVSMMMDMAGSPIIGRRNNRSSAKPRSAAARSVVKKASQNGTFKTTTSVRQR